MNRQQLFTDLLKGTEMLDTFNAINDLDENKNPSGGHVLGCGMHIYWQNGPLGRGPDRIEANGAFVETVIAAAKQRLDFYQEANDGKFWCEENASAIQHLERALEYLNLRTQKREARQVEGTHIA